MCFGKVVYKTTKGGSKPEILHIMSKMQCCGSGMCSRIRIFSIPDPGSNRFPDPGSGSSSASKNLTQKLFPNSRKYDPGCSSRILDSDFGFLPIPDSGSRGQKGTGSRIRSRNTAKMKTISFLSPILTWPSNPSTRKLQLLH
jgi:hypothetical protein